MARARATQRARRSKATRLAEEAAARAAMAAREATQHESRQALIDNLPTWRSTAAVPAGTTYVGLDYDSLSALIADAERVDDRGLELSRRASRTERGTWNGGASWDETLKLARTGWAEGTSNIVDLTERLDEKVAQQLPAYGMTLEETGGEVDVPTYMAGERACWWDWTDAGGSRPVVRITLNACVSFTVSERTILMVGSMVAALADALEHLGRRVEIDLLYVNTTMGRRGYSRVQVALKRADDPLDRATVAFALAHPGMFRRLVFALWENLPASYRSVGSVPGGYGHVGTVPESLRGDVHVEIENVGHLDFLDAYEWVLKHLKQLGVEVGE